MIKILSVFGTRPEAIKMAPVIRALRCHPDSVVSKICVTAQHRQMLDQVLDLFEITPDYDLNVMQADQTPTRVAATVMAQLEPIFRKEQPDWVLVQGDTTTVAAAAWAAFYARIKVGHVEAGLRTYDKYQPFPEEINRRIASVIATLHFAPTTRSRDNLLQEGIPATTVFVTGNPVIDALQHVVALPSLPLSLPEIPSDRRIILVTVHRRENFGEPFEQICQALRDLAEMYAGQVQMIYPVHLNPNVQAPVQRWLKDVPGITLLPPLDYLPLVQLLKRADLVLTDSGGIQEEAPSLGKPVLVLRSATERPEAVDAGTVRLVGADRTQIVQWTRRLLDNPTEYQSMARATNPYGDGHAAPRIVQALLNYQEKGIEIA
ncbi:UDP-N-acetylglucosamine 2-epimerase [Gammaproteobacteria bacterium]